jgi:uncharacterized protein YqeY
MTSAISEARLRQDLQAAMKAREMPTVYVLRGLLAVAANLRIEKSGAELSDGELLGLVQREAKKREEAAGFARTAGRDDLVAQNEAELAILRAYLPRALDDAEIQSLLTAWIAEGIAGMGPLMARLKERHAGQYDGKRASEIARTLLAAR